MTIGAANSPERAGLQKLDLATVAMVEPRPLFNQPLREILKAVGFRTFTPIDSLEDLARQFSSLRADLLIVCETINGQSASDLIRDIRGTRKGGDPFVPIVLTSPNVTEAIAKRAVNSGADLLWGFPLSHTGVYTGVDRIVQARRPFVVTNDYIGPDRRQKSRAGGRQIPLIEVPNRLRSTVTGETARASRVAYVALVNRLRVERHVEQVAWLMDRLRPSIERGEMDDTVQRFMQRLFEVASEMVERIRLTVHRDQVDVCRRLRTASDALLTAPSMETLDAVERLVPELEQKIVPVVSSDSAQDAVEQTVSVR